MGEIRKHIKFDDIGTLQFYYNEMHEKSVYEANYHNGMKQKLTANKIAENILSQVYS